MLDSSFGVVNWAPLLGLISDPIQFASNAAAAFFAVCFMMILGRLLRSSRSLLLAGLQSIPEEQYQAAKVDAPGGLNASSTSRCQPRAGDGRETVMTTLGFL